MVVRSGSGDDALVVARCLAMCPSDCDGDDAPSSDRFAAYFVRGYSSSHAVQHRDQFSATTRAYPSSDRFAAHFVRGYSSSHAVQHRDQSPATARAPSPHRLRALHLPKGYFATSASLRPFCAFRVFRGYPQPLTPNAQLAQSQIDKSEM